MSHIEEKLADTADGVRQAVDLGDPWAQQLMMRAAEVCSRAQELARTDEVWAELRSAAAAYREASEMVNKTVRGMASISPGRVIALLRVADELAARGGAELGIAGRCAHLTAPIRSAVRR